MREFFKHLIIGSFIADFPVRVRHGLCEGAYWTLFPFSSYWRGTVDGDLSDVIREYGCVPDTVAWDVGAHFGYYAVAIAMAGSEVFAFEPSKYSYEKLIRHIRQNSLSNISPIKAAASDKAGTTLIYAGTSGSSTAHLSKRESDLEAGQETIKTIRLDDLVDDGTVKPPAFIKIDVEGHGRQVLEGGIQTILEYEPVIVMDWHTSEEVHSARTLLSEKYTLLDLHKNPLIWERPGAVSLLLPGV